MPFDRWVEDTVLSPLAMTSTALVGPAASGMVRRGPTQGPPILSGGLPSVSGMTSATSRTPATGGAADLGQSGISGMTELVDVRADAVGPGEYVCFGDAVILITAVECGDRVVDLHTEYGPALRLLRGDEVPVVLVAEEAGAA